MTDLKEALEAPAPAPDRGYNPARAARTALTLGGRLKQARLASGLSLPQFADILGVSRVTAWGWEADKIAPRKNKRISIAHALEVPPEVLFTDEAGSRSDITTMVADCRYRIAQALGTTLSEVAVTISFGQRDDLSIEPGSNSETRDPMRSPKAPVVLAETKPARVECFSFGQLCRAMYCCAAASSVERAGYFVKAWQRQGYLPRATTGSGRPGNYSIDTVWVACLVGVFQTIGVSPGKAFELLRDHQVAPLSEKTALFGTDGKAWISIELAPISKAIKAQM